MTDESQASHPHPSQSYRECVACGCQVHQSRDACPECGAFPHEDYPPTADSKVTVILTSVLVGFLALALFGFSRNKEAAAKLETEKFSRLELQETLTPLSDKSPFLTSPTPTEVPLVVPTPLPASPTPIPFRPEDFQTQPTLQPLPQATQVPVAPTPVPEPTRPSTLELKDQLADEFRADLDNRFPMAKEGEYVRLTTLENRIMSGTIVTMEANQLALNSTRGQQWVVYRRLSRESRMRVDKSERETWVEEKALEEVLKRLQN
jgi:hypothetical protein